MEPIRKNSVLVIEDNEADAEFLAALVHRSRPEIEITVATDGEAAVARLLDPSIELPGLLLLDINLPRLSGHEVLRRIRADARCRYLPVVMLSTSRADRDVRGALDGGANAYVCKPFGVERAVEVLNATVAFWLDAAEIVDEEPSLAGR